MAGDRPDWRDPDAYASLLTVDRSGWAWEWLRRDDGYRRAARGAANRGEPASRPHNWGLHRFEDPALGAAEARPLWTHEYSAFVLDASVGVLVSAGIDLEGLTRLKRRLGGERILIANGLSALRLDIAPDLAAAATFLVGAAPERLGAQIVALQQVERLARTGCLATAPLSRARAARLARLLRVSDALATDASQRRIAEHLFDSDAAKARWRIELPTVRLQVQRLVRQARTMAAGGFRALLLRND
ncbi:DUF2285 domain-containing protein [Sphingomonas sp. ASV193]|uniref:DNA -binding domain-containing protein n=1 Tax=Sphingomonas sp. ASV193 TaxID=3144405 RepID=UPI0032E8A250